MSKHTFKFWEILTVFLILQAFLFYPKYTAYATTDDLQAQIDAANQQISILSQKIAEYQAELTKVGADKKTLQAAINSLDIQKSKVSAQISVTQNQIKSTELQLKQLGKQVSNTKQTIVQYKEELTQTIRSINESYNQSVLTQMLTAPSLSAFWQQIEDEIEVQNAVLKKTKDLQAKEKDLANKQSEIQSKKDELAAHNKNLASQQADLSTAVKSKNKLLTETKNKESNYQKLISQAKAELKNFSNFTKNAGGAKLISNQTVCDDWGCYYNQRDTKWGAQSLNGTEYTLASDGCLVTSVAMLMTHYGHRSVTPASINANPNNFASYYPAYLLYTISADGVTASRVTATIDSSLNAGIPVVVGMNVKGGTHFVVLTSGSSGNYLMRDPYIANGKDVNFTDHYSVKSIYSIAKLVLGK